MVVGIADDGGCGSRCDSSGNENCGDSDLAVVISILITIVIRDGGDCD